MAFSIFIGGGVLLAIGLGIGMLVGKGRSVGRMPPVATACGIALSVWTFLWTFAGMAGRSH